MTQADLTRIRELAAQFRAAIEAVRSNLPIQFTDFPLGACGDTTLLLGEYLLHNNCGIFDSMEGWRDGKSHAWLQRDDVVIDITGDQFPDISIPVFVQ